MAKQNEIQKEQGEKEKTPTEESSDPKYYIQQGLNAYQQKDYKKAIELWKIALKYDKNNPVATKYIGIAEKKLQESQE